MEDKNLIKKIQKDLALSNAKIINNQDNTSDIKKNFNSKYTEDISDSESDSDLTSYKNRNIKMISQLPDKNNDKNNNKNTKENKQQEKKNVNKSVSNKKSKSESDSDSDSSSQDEKSNSGSGSGSDSEHQYEYTEEFKKKVKDYVKNDDRIRELQTELKLLNNAKKNAENEILKHLERLGETNINITGGKLRINQYESKEGLKEDIVKEALSEKIKDPTIIEFIFEKINEKRVANGKVQKSLKRTFERGGKKEKK